MIDPVVCATSDTDHSAVFHGNIASASVAAEYARRLYPAINIVLGDTVCESLVDTRRPQLTPCELGSSAPDFCDSIGHCDLHAAVAFRPGYGRSCVKKQGLLFTP